MQDDQIGLKFVGSAPANIARLPHSINKIVFSVQKQTSPSYVTPSTLNLHCYTREIVHFLTETFSFWFLDFYADMLQKPPASAYSQGCQMVCFQTKNPNLGKFWRFLLWKILVYFMTIGNILLPFGIHSLW
jgi:hypothetical protein